ncbi:antitoxin (DNA-binding transcriptional repressor) of toxin-antitoxin stability system [Streptomyces sp. V4I8]
MVAGLWNLLDMTKIPVSEAGSELEDLVRRASHGRETIALTDHGQVVALLVPPQVIEDLEDALAVADYRRRKAEGTLGEGIPHEEVRRVLGLSP